MNEAVGPATADPIAVEQAAIGGWGAVATEKGEMPELDPAITGGDVYPEVADYEEDMFADARSEYSENSKGKGRQKKLFRQNW